MLTYVINTSENKTFDSDLLFELAGYSKIRWMHCRLDEVEECAEEICCRQNVLGADVFRIAVLVDFYCFDRIRRPYGDNGYREDPGVDLCIYYPYIETYLSDHLFNYLEKRNLHSATREIYYIQNEKNDKYSFLANREEQMRKIMTPVLPAPEAEGEERQPQANPEDEAYEAFRIYCTPEVSLTFRVADYPYRDGQAMTFSDFIHEVHERTAAYAARVNEKTHIISHTYVTAYGGGSAMAAFDTLALSLYLVRIYEREEEWTDTEVEIDHVNPVALKNVLERAWNKVRLAQEIATGNQCEYYSLDIDTRDRIVKKQSAAKKKKEEESSAAKDGKTDRKKEAADRSEKGKEKEKEAVSDDEAAELQKFRARVTGQELDFPIEELYRRITEYASCRMGEASEADHLEFDRIMGQYLSERDSTRDVTVQKEFDQLRQEGGFKLVKQCPSKLQYDLAVQSRQKEISNLFGKTLQAEYLKTDYADVREKSNRIYGEYLQLKARRSKWIIADVVLLVLMLAAMLIPYHFLQEIRAFEAMDILRYIRIGAVFGGLFVLSFLCVVLPVSVRIRRVREKLKECLRLCIAKHKYAMSALERRYCEELPLIEQIRYEIRSITHLQEKNDEKNRNVNLHRETLEGLENRLSAILNNLGVEPEPNAKETVEGEFDLQRPIRAAENKLYRIFSIETIESMFDKKGEERG